MSKISFDFDGVLFETPHDKHMLKHFRMLQHAGHEMYIITTRYNLEISEDKRPYYVNDVFRIAKRLNVPEERIFFTEHKWKAETLQKLEIDVHYDDNWEEWNQAQKSPISTKIILIEK